MSIIQNFKDADHTFEKMFLKGLFKLASVMACYFLIFRFFDKFPEVKSLFRDNERELKWFLIGFVMVCSITIFAYMRSLDGWEGETKATIKVAVFSGILWAFFWALWGIYCAWLSIGFHPIFLSIKITIGLLAFVPPLAHFLISRNFRKESLKEETNQKQRMGADYYKFDPFVICLDRKYFSGYYALITIPVFLGALLILTLWHR